MPEPSEQEKMAERLRKARRQSEELEQDRSQLHDRLIETGESIRRSHEQTAETMDNLADSGAAEHVTRRRRAAERSRRFAEEEARQIAELEGRTSGETNQRSGTDEEDTDPT